MDEVDRLMREPRRCRVCRKACQGVRCGTCNSVEGRLIRFLEAAGQALSEDRLRGLLQVDMALRALERDGQVHESGDVWKLGRHPDQIALQQAFDARKARAPATSGGTTHE